MLLKDEAYVFEDSGPTPVAAAKSLIENAADLALRWPQLSVMDKRGILHALVARADVPSEAVDVSIRPAVLPLVVRPDLDVRRLPTSPDGPARVLSVPARLRRTGMNTRLLVQGAFAHLPAEFSGVGRSRRRSSRDTSREAGNTSAPCNQAHARWPVRTLLAGSAAAAGFRLSPLGPVTTISNSGLECTCVQV